MNSEIFITCAITGAGDTVGKHPDIPVTPKEIAEASLDAAKAGAAVVHIHVRDPSTGKGSRDPALFRETVERIRESDTDVVINLTAGMGGEYYWNPTDPMVAGKGSDIATAGERLQHVVELKPEICTLDVATMSFADGSTFLNTPDCLIEMANIIKAVGTKPEMECFDIGHVGLAKHLIKNGHILGTPMFQLCLGILWGAPADTESMLSLRNQLPEDAVWSSFGISRMQMPMVAQSVILGGNVRVGLEDNLYLSKDQFASNAQLVERAVGIVDRLGVGILGPQDTRDKLQLTKHS